MTLGDLHGLLSAGDRVVSTLRRPSPDLLLARLAELADDPQALSRLHSQLERLARAVVDCRTIPVSVELRDPPTGNNRRDPA